MESALDEQPASIPALDIVVEDMELRGKKLGRVEIDAVNLGAAASSVVRDAPREWRLNRFNIITPEAQLTASGNWTAVAGATPLTSKNIKERRRTQTLVSEQLAFARDIVVNEQRLAARILDPFGGAFALFAIHVRNHDAGALARQQLRRGLA